MTDRPSWVPEEIDVTRPSIARVYDYALGGSHNFAADRAFAERVFAAMPDAVRHARDNRAFLRRAVQYLVGAGVDQFLDLGSGIPTVGSVHEVAHAGNPAARVVYVDSDPVAVLHSRELLAGDPRIAVLGADLRDPERVLGSAEVRGTLDLARPVAVLLVSVLHFVADADDPAGVVARYLGPLAPGSALVISHGTAVADTLKAASLYDGGPSSPGAGHARTRAQVAALFGELTLVEPGLVRMPAWRPAAGVEPDEEAEHHLFFVGVARKE